jgi:hypothetical protein
MISFRELTRITKAVFRHDKWWWFRDKKGMIWGPYSTAQRPMKRWHDELINTLYDII